MEKDFLKFDPKKVDFTHEHASYHIQYFLFHSNEDTTNLDTETLKELCKGEIKENSNKACFAGLAGTYGEYDDKDCFKKTPNRIRFVCNPTKHESTKVHLSKEEITRWVELCKKNKLMPENIGENFIENNIYDISITEVSLSMLYIYLCSPRYIQDEPFFPRAVIYLHDELGMGFFTAIGVASMFCATNKGHHWIPIARDYRLKMTLKNINDETNKTVNEFDFEYVSKLALFVNGGDKGKKIGSLKSLPYFSLHADLDGMKLQQGRKGTTILRHNLNKKYVEKHILAGTLRCRGPKKGEKNVVAE